MSSFTRLFIGVGEMHDPYMLVYGNGGDWETSLASLRLGHRMGYDKKGDYSARATGQLVKEAMH
jgi:hypothetical protein